MLQKRENGAVDLKRIRKLSDVEKELKEEERKRNHEDQQEHDEKMRDTPEESSGRANGTDAEALPYQDTSIQPSCTMYLNHLNERLTVTQLRLILQELCSRFGTILDLVVHDSLRRRGQAWVVYETVDEATKAIEALHGLELDGKRIGAQYAKGKSDAIAKRDGTYETQKRKREIERKLNAGLDMTSAILNKRRRLDQTTGAGATTTATTTTGALLSSQTGPSTEAPVVPHNVLLVQGLSEDATKEDLEGLFSSLAGYQQVRFIGAKRVAFVDFDTEQHAGAGLALDGRKVHGQPLQVQYSKK